VIALWIAVAVLGALALWLGLALAGAVHELAALRVRLDALELRAGAPDHLASGLPPGAPAPTWEAVGADGSPVSSALLAGRRHLVVFADADCAGCHELVPSVVDAAAHGALLPTAVIANTPLDAAPTGWRTPPGTGRLVVVGSERDRAVSDRFLVDLTPTVFVIDEDGAVVARGTPTSLEETHELVRSVDGVRIVAGAGDG
jgi:Redoxin